MSVMDNDSISQTSADVSLSNEEANLPVDHAQYLLQKLEAANRQIETDAKSVSSLRFAQSSQTSPERRISAAESAVETAYWKAWAALIQDWETTKKNKDSLREMVKKGIPQPLRAIAWQLLANAQDSPFKSEYVSLISKSGPFDKAIQRDLARTFPNHEFFRGKSKRNPENADATSEQASSGTNDSQNSTSNMCEGQESLFNVLKAYSLYDREVGYCQGSAFIAGLLLLQLPEEESFCVFVKLLQEYRLRELFKPAMTELGLCIFQLENLLQEHLPKLYIHFASIGFHTTIYATSWFLTLFNTTFTLDVCSRIMDLFLLDGMEVIFRIAVAVLLLGEHDLLQLDMEGANSYMQSLSNAYQGIADALIQVAYDSQKVRINARSMKKWEKEYITIQSKQEEEQIEMRRLRTETKLLRQRLEYLEHENEHIADALVQYQLSTAEATDEINRLRAQIRKLKSSTTGSGSNRSSVNPTVLRDRDRDRDRDGAVSPGRSNAGDLDRPCSSCARMSAFAYSKETRLLIEELQTELITSRLKEAELIATVRDQKDRIAAIDEENKTLQRKLKAEVLALQDELISVKLREAETNLNLKDLELKLNNLHKLWKSRDQLVYKLHTADAPTSPTVPEPAAFGGQPKAKLPNSASFSFGFLSSLSGMSPVPTAAPNDASTTRTMLELQDELISSRLKEAELAADLRNAQKRMMELESQTQVVQRQLSRIEEESAELRERTSDSDLKQKQSATDCRTLEMRLAEVVTREKQKDVQFRILEVELRSQLADVEARLAANEIRALENTVASCTTKLENTQMYASTMSSSVFDPDAYRLQLTQSIVGDIDLSSSAETPPASTSASASTQAENAGQPQLDDKNNSQVKSGSLDCTQVIDRVSPYEKYGHLTPGVENDAD